MAAIDLQNVSKSFGQQAILQDISLHIANREFVVFVGPSGCGKSTLLRLIAGLETIGSGSITLGGTPIAHLHPKERDIAMVFQNYALYPHMTVAQNLGLALKLRGLDKRTIAHKIAEVAGMLEIDALLGKKARDLSGGQRQRVAMGRAIVRQPAVFLFDEPLSNLDTELRSKMRGELKRLHQRLQTTMVYVTHDQTEAMTLADRIVVLRQGRIQQVGTPLQVYRQPRSQFVASFLGTPGMNFLRATCHDGHLHFADVPLSVALPAGFACSTGQNLRVGIRPEHLRFTAPRAGLPALPAVVRAVEPLGADVLVEIACSGRPLTYRGPFADDGLRPGDALHVELAAQHMHLFDGDTGDTLRAHPS